VAPNTPNSAPQTPSSQGSRGIGAMENQNDPRRPSNSSDGSMGIGAMENQNDPRRPSNSSDALLPPQDKEEKVRPPDAQYQEQLIDDIV